MHSGFCAIVNTVGSLFEARKSGGLNVLLIWLEIQVIYLFLILLDFSHSMQLLGIRCSVFRSHWRLHHRIYHDASYWSYANWLPWQECLGYINDFPYCQGLYDKFSLSDIDLLLVNYRDGLYMVCGILRMTNTGHLEYTIKSCLSEWPMRARWPTAVNRNNGTKDDVPSKRESGTVSRDKAVSSIWEG